MNEKSYTGSFLKDNRGKLVIKTQILFLFSYLPSYSCQDNEGYTEMTGKWETKIIMSTRENLLSTIIDIYK